MAWCYKMSSALRGSVHSQPKFTENTTIIRLQNYTLFKNQWIVYATITVCWREIVTDTESLALKWWTANDTDHRLRPGYAGWHLASSMPDGRKYSIINTSVLAAQCPFLNSTWNWHFPMGWWIAVISSSGGKEDKTIVSTGELDTISFTSVDPDDLV